jgi:hypothetical protein
VAEEVSHARSRHPSSHWRVCVWGCVSVGGVHLLSLGASAPFLLGVAMRYLLLLLFLPSAVFASCAPGVNYGSAHIVSGNPICYLYSGSTKGGCYAYCGGGADGSVCVELPNAVPPSRGPYFSSGQECTPNDSNGPGKDPNPPVGEDGTATGGNGVVNMGELWVGPTSHSDLGKGFNVVSNNIKVSSEKVSDEIKKLDSNFKDFADRINPLIQESSQDLKRISNNTANLANAIGQSSDTLNAQLMMLNGKQVLDSSFWNNKEERLIGTLNDIRKDMSYMNSWPQQESYLERILAAMNNSSGGGGGFPETGLMSIYSIDSNLNQLREVLAGDYSPYMRGMEDSNQLLKDISGKLDKIGQGGGEGGGDKPCTGPLCSFNKPLGSSGSALSSVFGPESIEDIKKQVEVKNTEITKTMDDIKRVFVSERISISGTYDNDYQEIHGVNVDLSGKSNMELFFNSGPKQAIWFLAVLIAFAILMGGRKNA